MQVFICTYIEHDTNGWLIKQIVNSEAHSVSYTLSRGNAVVVEYSKDPTTDMFQVWNYETLYKFWCLACSYKFS